MIVPVYLILLIFSSFYDIKYHRVKDIVHLIILLLAVLKWYACISILLYSVVYAFLQTVFIFLLLKKSDFIGGGDIKFMFANCLFLGFNKAVLGVIIGCISLFLVNIRKPGEIPMLPYLSLGYLLSLLIYS